ncbi:MAG: NAD(P)/FAD-dependent oxidoreductase [Pseudomonadota bacterium]
MQYVDVIIIGAGISGTSMAYHLQSECPDKSYLVLEGRATPGGTWDLFRYPGIRSDSDMHTLGFRFRPWKEAKAIADGPSILRYVTQAQSDYGINRNIRFGHRVVKASWSTAQARWLLAVDTPEGRREFACNFLSLCGGYYEYDRGHTPEFAGRDDFSGTVIHPQHWPEDLDYAGKRVLIIGSGATAMTLVPAMADTAEHVTMLQRSPTYVVSRPAQDGIANALRRFLPDTWAYALARIKNIGLGGWFYRRMRANPEKAKERLIDMTRKQLPADYDIDTHFTPRYHPWDQRLCLLPDGDLFKALREERASIVTGGLERFTATGVRLDDGRELAADIIVTATGLRLSVGNGIDFSVDGETLEYPDKLSYKGMMLSDVPNMVQTFGYINASWTLRADLTSEYVCRLINALDEKGVQQVTPRLRAEDRDMPRRDWIEDFSAGYMRRDMHRLPKQGDREPWLNTQNFQADRKMIRHAPLEDGVLVFDNPPGMAAATAVPEALDSASAG